MHEKLVIPANWRNRINIILDLLDWEKKYIHMREHYVSLKIMLSKTIDIRLS